jgi:iron(III) transport system permease protein
MRAVRARPAFPLGVAAFAFAFLGLFLVYPLVQVFKASFLDASGTAATLANYAKVLTTPFYRASVVNSLAIGFSATFATAAVGVPMAFLLARLPVPGRAAVLALSTLPLVLPSFVGAYAWVLLLGRSGLVTQALASAGLPTFTIYGIPGLVLVYTLHSFPYVLLPTLSAFLAVDASVEEAGQNLGASRWRTFWTVTFPLVVPSVLAGALLVFMETLENFGVPFVLAEDMPVLPVETYKLFVGEAGANPASAGALAVLLLCCTTAALLLQRRYVGRRRFATQLRSPPPPLRCGRWARLGAAAFAWGVILLALVPFFAVVVLSFMKFRGPVLHPEFTLDNYVRLFGRSLRPLANTLVLATTAAVAGSVVGVPIGYVLTRYRSNLAHALDVVATAPFAVAGTVLAIGLVIAYNSGWLVLTGGWLILVLAYLVRKMPFSVRASAAILHQIDPALEEASINLGVPPARTFATLTVPLMMGGVVGGTVLAWVTIVSELSSTIILYSGPWATMTIVMFQSLEGTSAGAASAAATVLILATVVPLALVWRLLRRHQVALI